MAMRKARAGAGDPKASAPGAAGSGVVGPGGAGEVTQRIFRVAALMAIWALAWVVAARMLERLAPSALDGPGPGAPPAPGWAALALGGVAVALCAGHMLGRARRMRASDAWTITLLLAVGSAGMALLGGAPESAAPLAEQAAVAEASAPAPGAIATAAATPARALAGLAPLAAALTYRRVRRRRARG
ncbi:MAG: hypothetical protein VYD87_20615 [Pseudomonadota bacterium]|nr:hypothetical protein [Pseudomonadota bacterium]